LKPWLDDKGLVQSYEDAIDLRRERGTKIPEVSLDHDPCEAHSDGDFSDVETACDVVAVPAGVRSAAGLQRMTDLLESFEQDVQ